MTFVSLDSVRAVLDPGPPGQPAADDAAPLKLRLRATARRRRAELAATDRAVWSAQIARSVGSLLPAEGMVMTYAAMGDELDLAALNTVLAATSRLVLPRVEGKRLVAVFAPMGVELVSSPFGVPEPTGPGLPPEALAAVVVPGLAFDRRGFRVGYGAGFYDRFLPGLRPGCLVLGVCFAAQLVEDIGPEPHDVAVGRVVTERG